MTGAGNLQTSGILLAGVNDFTIQNTGAGTGQFAGQTGARYIYVADPNATLNMSIRFTGSAIPITKSGAGFLAFTRTTDQVILVSNAITIAGGTLRATIEGASLNFGTFNALKLRGGVFEVDSTTVGGGSTFSRALGQGAGQVNWSNGPTDGGSGGFSAFGGSLTVNLGGAGTPQTVTWGATTDFVQDGHALIFGSTKSNNTVVWQNPINLGGNLVAYESREIRVIAGTGVAADRTRFDGVISGATATTELLKTGTGVLELTAANSYQGNTLVLGGTLLANNTSGSATGLGKVLVAAGATLGGSGFVVPATGGAATNIVTINGTVAPGNSVGTLTIGSPTDQATAALNGNYAWEISQTGSQAAANTGGSSPTASHDILTINGALALGSNWKTNLSWIGGSFDAGGTYSWLVATSSGGITGFSGNAVGSVSGFGGSVSAGDFSTSFVGNNLFLNFAASPVPEPSSFILAAIAAGVMALRIGRRRPADCSPNRRESDGLGAPKQISVAG